MKVSEKWLREWIDPPIDAFEICDQLTNLGLEVDGVEWTHEYLKGIVVGLITETESIATISGKTLTRCVVQTGDGSSSVVTGAPNSNSGAKVAYAKAGTTLANNQLVQSTRIAGIESEGVLCSESELGIGSDHSGLLLFNESAEIGLEIRDALELNDMTIDIDVTPNRGDCLSLRGVARELGVINRIAVTEPTIEKVSPVNEIELPIELQEGAACPRYLGRVIKNIKTDAVTPSWMVLKLTACGLRPIEAVVDVTNYVMLELGQPLHAFDLQEVANGIVVRNSKLNEELEMLDGSELKLDDETLLITDGQSPLAVAGVMGGVRSGIHPATSDVFLECAYFNPDHIIGTARKYGMQTDASMRYERGVDPELQYKAMDRATSLLCEIVGGEPGPVTVAEVDEFIPVRKAASLCQANLDRLIGEEIDGSEVEEILTRLALIPRRRNGGWDVDVPSHRFDISIEEDLVEEICRVHGYNEIRSSYPHIELNFDAQLSRVSESQALRDHIATQGYFEVVNYSFIDSESNDYFVPSVEAPELENPLATQYATMRKSLLPGLIDSARYNLTRQQDSVRLFEYGKCFSIVQDETLQQDFLGGIATGTRYPESWSQENVVIDFYDVKADVEELLALSPESSRFDRSECVYLHPGYAASIILDGQVIGNFGKLHPEITMEYELPEDTFVFEIQAEMLNREFVPSISHVAPFPYVRRDLALLVNQSVQVQSLIDVIHDEIGDLLSDLHVFDLYEGKNIEPGKKSLAIGLILQDASQTLTDEFVNEKIEGILNRLKSELDAVQR